MSDHIRHISQADWQKEVLASERPVAVDFYSTECPPCEALAAKYEALSRIYGADVTFIKIFRQENRELAASLGITGSPTVIFFRNGERVGDTLTGGIRRADLIRNLHALLPDQRAAELAAATPRTTTSADVAIIGAGPAGLTAAIYAAQAKRRTLVIDTALPGGNVSITHQVSNFPGFVAPQPGYLLAHYMAEQAKAAGAEFRSAVDVTRVDLHQREIVVDGLETICAEKIILATGTSPRLLNIPGEREFRGKGVSYCATCDAKYFEGKHAVVIGGGNSAVEEALFIARFAARITMVHQFDRFQANAASAQKILDHPGIEVLWSHEPRAFLATGGTVDAVRVEHLKSGEQRDISCDGAFIFAGMKPNLDLFGDGLTTDEWGYLVVDESMHTGIPHVFAAGDIVHKKYRQITTAVADGTIAAIAATAELDHA
jgi:thioredoxin reductase (NADPH)